MTADLERRLRALRDDLPEPPTAVDPEMFADSELVVLAESVPTRRRMRWVVAGLVAAALVAGVVTAVAAVRSGDHTDRRDAVSPPMPVDPATLIVRDGDRAEASGEVYAAPGKPVRFCAPAPTALGGAGSSGTVVDPLVECRYGVTVTGVDLGTLTERQTLGGGAVRGYADLTGTYSGGTLAVDTQSAYVRPTLDPGYDENPPCPAPSGGWPQGAADANIDTGPLADYEAAHPAEVVATATLRPSSTQAVAYLVTSGDVDAADAALRPHYGKALCVAHSDVTPAQLHAVETTFTAAMGSGATASDIYSLEYAYVSPYPAVVVDLVMVTPDLVDRAAAFPDLVRFAPWLVPVSS